MIRKRSVCRRPRAWQTTLVVIALSLVHRDEFLGANERPEDAGSNRFRARNPPPSHSPHPRWRRSRSGRTNLLSGVIACNRPLTLRNRIHRRALTWRTCVLSWRY